MTQLLPLHRRTVLVTIETARAVFGCSAREIQERIEAGRIRWAWDLRTDGHRIPDYRIWTRELITPEATAGFMPFEAVGLVIGTFRDRLRSVEVGQLLLVSRCTMSRLVTSGELAGPVQDHSQWIHRASLADFLLRRLIGAETATTTNH